MSPLSLGAVWGSRVSARLRARVGPVFGPSFGPVLGRAGLCCFRPFDVSNSIILLVVVFLLLHSPPPLCPLRCCPLCPMGRNGNVTNALGADRKVTQAWGGPNSDTGAC
eukprot:230465-Pyramimonas_sp.AAC.1